MLRYQCFYYTKHFRPLQQKLTLFAAQYTIISMSKLYFYVSYATDPYLNIAKECYLTDIMKGGAALYLWSNDRTVVIGKHQNAAKECDYELLRREGGFLARRLTGGGAVFHDIHNLNFSFVAPEALYDKQKHFSVIAAALKAFGLNAAVTGRNDMEIDGKKFSGNAFLTKNGVKLHHGTILINTDTGLMGRYLTVNKEKLVAHGVSSVRARVVNLCELKPDITKEKVISALKNSAEIIYGAKAAVLDESFFDKNYLERQRELLCSDRHLFGFETYSNSAERKFAWGNAEVNYEIHKGKIKAVNIFTDALDVEEIEAAKEFLLGKELAKLEPAGRAVFDDIISILK